MSDLRPDPAGRLTAPILLMLLLLSFVGLDRGLWTPDEPREAEIGREMLLAPGVVPTLNGETFIEKPPLYYWLVAGAYRIAGDALPAAARAVSVAASYLTLLAVYFWARRAHSPALGLVAAIMLATSLQFLLSGHWILVDPLLMLFTTVAAWTAWELLRGTGGWIAAVALYAGLVLALWTKGLIGPVLLGAGLSTYCLITRRFPWRPLHLGIGLPVMAGAVGILAIAILKTGGREALWEWAWVNHVQRFVDPQGTGHNQPLPYYLWTLPFALLPWAVPLLDALRPARWRSATPAGEFRLYCGALSGGMLLILTAASTKRGIYLLPVLPPVILAFAVNVLQWWANRADSRSLGAGWMLQAALLAMFAVAPPVAAWIYLRHADGVTVTFLLLAGAACVALVVAARRGEPGPALVAMGASALLAATGCLALAPRVLDREKDMAPFMAAMDRRLPPGEPVPALGADETLLAIVPFVTGRPVVRLDPVLLGSPPTWQVRPPLWILMQTKVKKQTAKDLGPSYVLVDSRKFGPGRHVGLWMRVPEYRPDVASADDGQLR